MKIEVIIGSTREGRFGDKVAKWIFNKLQKVEGIESELIDLRDWPLPMFDEPVSPSMNKGNYKSELGKKWAEKIGEGDGYIIVTPEYNHSYSAVLKNAIDYVYKEWNNKPVSFVSYGGAAGGSRAVQHLRNIATEIQLFPLRNGVHIVNYWLQLDENGNLKTGPYEQAAQNLIDQLIMWARNLKALREAK